MPRIRIPTVQFPVRNYGLGSGDSISLKLAFPNCPIYDGTLSTDEQVRATFENAPELVDGVINDGANTFGLVNRYYQDAPDLTEVQVGGGGKPGSPYAPNIASATDPNNPGTIPDSGVVATERNRGSGGFGVGDGFVSPKTTTQQLVPRRIGDSFVLGRSTRS